MADSTSEQQPSVAVLTRDLFFGMRIRNALKQLGYTTELKKTEAEFSTALADPACALGFVDFNNPVEWSVVTQAVEAREELAVIAFGSHTDTESFRQARDAGVTRVISNGAFSQQLPELVERYARRT